LQPRFLRLNRLSRRSQREVRQRSLVCAWKPWHNKKIATNEH
jgi:hypothetical protein